MVPAWRRSSSRKRLSFNSSRLPRTSRLTWAAASLAVGGCAERATDAFVGSGAARAGELPFIGLIPCGPRHKYTKPSAKIEAKPPTRIHFKLSRRAGTVVAATVVASAPEASSREFTEALPELSGGPVDRPSPTPGLEPGSAEVPETFIVTGASAATAGLVYTLKP